MKPLLFWKANQCYTVEGDEIIISHSNWSGQLEKIGPAHISITKLHGSPPDIGGVFNLSFKGLKNQFKFISFHLDENQSGTFQVEEAVAASIQQEVLKRDKKKSLISRIENLLTHQEEELSRENTQDILQWAQSLEYFQSLPFLIQKNYSKEIEIKDIEIYEARELSSSSPHGLCYEGRQVLRGHQKIYFPSSLGAIVIKLASLKNVSEALIQSIERFISPAGPLNARPLSHAQKVSFYSSQYSKFIYWSKDSSVLKEVEESKDFKIIESKDFGNLYEGSKSSFWIIYHDFRSLSEDQMTPLLESPWFGDIT